MRYSFNINKLIDLLLANMFHKPAHVAWLRSGLKPLKTTYAELMTLRGSKLAEATITSSVNRITKALNDKFNATGIYLVHELDYVDSAFEFLAIDPHYDEFDYLGEENHTPPAFDFLSSEYDPDNDFIVRVPNALALRVNEIKAFIFKHTMAGRRFNIELY